MRFRLHGALFLVLLLTTTAVAQSQDFTYVINNSTIPTSIIITGYTGTNSVVTIPSTIAGLPVTRIGDYAFGLPAHLSVAHTHQAHRPKHPSARWEEIQEANSERRTIERHWQARIH